MSLSAGVGSPCSGPVCSGRGPGTSAMGTKNRHLETSVYICRQTQVNMYLLLFTCPFPFSLILYIPCVSLKSPKTLCKGLWGGGSTSGLFAERHTAESCSRHSGLHLKSHKPWWAFGKSSTEPLHGCSCKMEVPFVGVLIIRALLFHISQ